MERKLALSVCSVPGSAPCISVSWQIRLLGFRDRMLLISHSSGMIPSLWTPTLKLQKEPGRGWRFRMSWKKLVASFSGGFLTSDPPLTYYRLPHPCFVKPTGLPPSGNAMLPDPTSSTSRNVLFLTSTSVTTTTEEGVMSLTNGNLDLWYSFLFLLFV